MLVTEAVEFLSGAAVNTGRPTTWADLGCGNGFFTYILARMLAPGSAIHAIDTATHRLKSMAGNDVAIHFKNANFVTDPLELPSLDGILMANSLHYVADKKKLVDKLAILLNPGAMLIIIEYDTLRANPWVPYPIDFNSLADLFMRKGYGNIHKIGERQSVYGQHKMYACAIQP